MLKSIIWRQRLIQWEKLTPSQRELCARLDKLRNEVDAPTIQKSWFQRLVGNDHDETKRGLYIYGGVGQGKTVLMDQFYEKVRTEKMRVHFHDFMIKVQKELHLQKSDTDADIMQEVARKAVGSARLLCLDEFFVNHISDAMVLKPLFENIFKMGVVVICTSNRPPEDLYQNGLNRARFLPFIPLLRSHCDVFHLQARDFRQDYSFHDTSESTERVYFYDPNDKGDSLMSEFRRNCNNAIEKDKVIKVSDYRSVTVPLCGGQQAYFRFMDLCGSQSADKDSGKVQVSLGTEAFIVIANQFHTIWVSDVPQFDASNETDGSLRSFILLIDVLYERNIKLFIGSKTPMLRLFGIVGIVRIADMFQRKLESAFSSYEDFKLKYTDAICKEQFEKLATEMGLNQNEAKLLFEAVLPPDEVVISSQRIWDICTNHRDMLQGLPPGKSCLYKFDVRDESILENEFVCSRTLSRLFHMSSGNYHDMHRNRYTT